MFSKTFVTWFIFLPWLISCKIQARILQVSNQLAKFLQVLKSLITRVVVKWSLVCKTVDWKPIYFLFYMTRKWSRDEVEGISWQDKFFKFDFIGHYFYQSLERQQQHQQGVETEQIRIQNGSYRTHPWPTLDQTEQTQELCQTKQTLK